MIIGSVWRLSRAEGALLAFALILVPYIINVGGFWPAIWLALPIIPIAMCTFILNDINDIERDSINHPHRPLPSGLLSIRVAALIYLILFIASLVLVRTMIGERVQYIYLLGFLIAINYATIVNHIPVLKNAYVAFACLIPFEIVNTAADRAVVPLAFMAGVFLFMLGREMLMDIRDTSGDGPTLVKMLPVTMAPVVAFALQLAGIVALATLATNLIRLSTLLPIIVLWLVTIAVWHAEHQRAAINLMKIQMVLAIGLLV